MIAKVMTYKGQTMSIAALYTLLIQKYTSLGRQFPKECAAGSIGGAVRGGFIELNANGDYVRKK